MSRPPPAMLEDTGAICGWLMSSKTGSYALPNLRTPHFAMRLSGSTCALSWRRPEVKVEKETPHAGEART